MTRAVHVHVSSKDAHVLAVAGRQTVAVHLRKGKVAIFHSGSDTAPTKNHPEYHLALEWKREKLGFQKILMRPGLKHLGSGHH